MLRAVTSRSTFAFTCAMLFAATIPAQQSTSPLGNVLGARALPGENGFNAVIATSNVDIYVQEASGAPVEGITVITLKTLSGQFYRQPRIKARFLSVKNWDPRT